VGSRRRVVTPKSLSDRCITAPAAVGVHSQRGGPVEGNAFLPNDPAGSSAGSDAAPVTSLPSRRPGEHLPRRLERISEPSPVDAPPAIPLAAPQPPAAAIPFAEPAAAPAAQTAPFAASASQTYTPSAEAQSYIPTPGGQTVAFAPMPPATAPYSGLTPPTPISPQNAPASIPLTEDAGAGGGGQRAGSETGKATDALLADLLQLVIDRRASDLHLTASARPTLRLNGSLHQLEEFDILTPQTLQQMLYAMLTQKQREKFEENLELDFAYSLPGRARFRVNIYKQRDMLGAAFRLIPYEIKRLEDLGVMPAVANFAMLPRGFVLVTGPTGSGKSTTLASIVDLANRSRRDHIMTVEDPIEFLHEHRQSLVNQREVGEDTLSFGNALKHVLRQDPDIILVGEMRDLETISVALTAAETGHLVFATLHTQDAAQTIDRVIDVFPPHQQQQIRVQLAGALQGIVCQTLCKTSDGRGRVVASEVLIATPAIRNLIREGKTHQIYSALQAGGKFGMSTMDQNLADLVKAGRITYEVGLEKCHHVEDFNRLAGRG
jgi:twitching motility protein PilT